MASQGPLVHAVQLDSLEMTAALEVLVTLAALVHRARSVHLALLEQQACRDLSVCKGLSVLRAGWVTRVQQDKWDNQDVMDLLVSLGHKAHGAILVRLVLLDRQEPLVQLASQEHLETQVSPLYYLVLYVDSLNALLLG